MEKISQDKFDKADELDGPQALKVSKPRELSEQEFKLALEDMQNPVESQKRIAVKLKHYLDWKIEKEMEEKGILSDHTRRWVETFNSILEKLQKSLYGDKSINLHLHKVSHSQIATQMRAAEKEEKKKKKKVKVEDYR